MNLGARIKEERQRLGLNQTEFAALVGASRRAMVNWESGESAPLTTALTAWAEAGADAVYILTGRRAVDRPDTAEKEVEDDLAEIRRNILEPSRIILPGQTVEQAEEQTIRQTANQLRAMLRHDTSFMTSEILEEVQHLLDIVEDPLKLSMYRAADHVQKRKKREEMRGRLSSWFEGGPYEPGETVMTMLTMLALEYSVPIVFLADLVYEMHTDIIGRSLAK